MANRSYSSFTEYWDSLDAEGRTTLAKRSGLSKNHLWQVARGYRRAGVETMAKLQKVNRNLTARVMRPDLYE